MAGRERQQRAARVKPLERRAAGRMDIFFLSE
jgi:hypothetical protein